MDDPAPVTVRDRERFASSQAASLAIDCLLAGIEAARPATVINASVSIDGSTLALGDATYDLDEYDRVLLVGGGNAAGRVAAELEARLGDRIDGGIVVTDDPVPLDRVESITGSHPTPDRAALDGTDRLLDLVADASERDLLIGVVTGGGSALLPAPAGDVSLDDLQTLTDDLVRSGATIDEINAVRKHVSALKGGRLARAAAPATVRDRIDRGADATEDAADGTVDADEEAAGPGAPEVPTETPGADDPAFDAVGVHVLASNDTAIKAAAEAARDAGVDPLVLSTRIRGEARTVGTVHAGIAQEVRASGRPIEPPAVLLSGGETTVSVGDASGAGGPNQELALAAALDLADQSTVLASVDTDGIDGATDAAGALVTGRTIDGAISAPAARDALDSHDAYPVLDDAGALLRTGPTGTNANDLRVIVVPEDG